MQGHMVLAAIPYFIYRLYKKHPVFLWFVTVAGLGLGGFSMWSASVPATHEYLCQKYLTRTIPGSVERWGDSARNLRDLGPYLYTYAADNGRLGDALSLIEEVNAANVDKCAHRSRPIRTPVGTLPDQPDQDVLHCVEALRAVIYNKPVVVGGRVVLAGDGAGVPGNNWHVSEEWVRWSRSFLQLPKGDHGSHPEIVLSKCIPVVQQELRGYSFLQEPRKDWL